MFSLKIFVEGREISASAPSFIISEIGSNHSNDFNKACEMINISKKLGADAVKFQSYRAETLYSKYTPLKKMGPEEKEMDLHALIKSLEMPYDWHKKLKTYCDEVGIIFLSSPFDYEAVDSLEEANVSIYKIASSEISDKNLVKYIARKGKPIIISSGKHTIEEIEDSLRWISEEGNNDVILLHCTASYPAENKSMNMKCLRTFQNRFNILTGLSDHNTENLTAVSAIALGACVIEKHFTLNKLDEGPDHHFALNPDGLKELVKFVRDTEDILGDGVKRIEESEKEGRRIGNRSIHASRNLTAGTIVKKEDLIIKRPGLGLKPYLFDSIIGKRLVRDVKEDMWICREDIDGES